MDLVANHLYKQKIEPVTEIDEHLPKVDADPQQLEQVLVNLYLNAIDAMPDGGSLTVRASLASKSPENDTAGEVIISVTDTGFGIEPENLPKIFHPFFTAKKKTGLGLGLSICERIVKNHGGRIEVESEQVREPLSKSICPSSMIQLNWPAGSVKWVTVRVLRRSFLLARTVSPTRRDILMRAGRIETNYFVGGAQRCPPAL